MNTLTIDEKNFLIKMGSYFKTAQQDYIMPVYENDKAELIKIYKKIMGNQIICGRCPSAFLRLFKELKPTYDMIIQENNNNVNKGIQNGKKGNRRKA